MLERAEDASDRLRGALQLSGRSVGQRQLEMALDSGSARIVCLCSGIGPDVIALQHVAERAGAKFVTARGAKGLLGQVTATDELLVLADGVLPLSPVAGQLLELGQGILTLPAPMACDAGFERIDHERAWAGAMLLPGRMVERLAELPTDIDPMSALLRIALQSQVPLRALAEEEMTEGRWFLALRSEYLAKIEPDWIRRHAPAPDICSPGKALARLAARAAGGRLFGGRNFALIAGVASPVLAVLAVAGSYLGFAAAGLVASGFAFVTLYFRETHALIRREGRRGSKRERMLGTGLALLLDLSLFAALALALRGDWHERLFMAALPVLLARLVPAILPQRPALLLADRPLLAIVFALAAWLGALTPVIQLTVVLALALGCLHKARSSG